MSAFDYGSAEAWESSTDILLPVGSHLCTIAEAEPSHTKGGNGREPKPQIELKVENESGSRRDWLVITPRTVGKIAQLFDAAGVPRPSDGEFDSETGELTTGCVSRLVGKRVGVVVRLEDSLKNPGQQEPRISGYVEPARITDDAPADTRGMGNGASSSAAADDRIPF